MESGDEDEAFTMGEREWQKMSRDMSKQGFRDGKTEGREKGRQQSFERATTLALKHSLKLGQMLGILEWKLTQTTENDERKKLGAMRDKLISQLEIFKGYSVNDSSSIEMESKAALIEIAEELLSLKVLKLGEVEIVSKMME